MQTNTLYKNGAVSNTVRQTLDPSLVEYLWKLVDDRDDNQSSHMFVIGEGELFGMGILQVLHEQDGDERMHKVFGIPPVEAVVLVRRQADGYHMEMGWEICAA